MITCLGVRASIQPDLVIAREYRIVGYHDQLIDLAAILPQCVIVVCVLMEVLCAVKVAIIEEIFRLSLPNLQVGGALLAHGKICLLLSCNGIGSLGIGRV